MMDEIEESARQPRLGSCSSHICHLMPFIKYCLWPSDISHHTLILLYGMAEKSLLDQILIKILEYSLMQHDIGRIIFLSPLEHPVIGCLMITEELIPHSMVPTNKSSKSHSPLSHYAR